MDKIFLTDEFSTAKSIGLFIGDANGLPVENTQHDDALVVYLSSGDDVADSVGCACYVASKYKANCDVYGFNQLGSSLVKHEHLRDSNAHYFAVIDKRYIVDIWLRHHCKEDNFIFDLRSESDRKDIVERYGSPRLWSVLGHDRIYRPFENGFPKDKVLSLSNKSKAFEKEM